MNTKSTQKNTSSKLRKLLAELYGLGVEGNEWNNERERKEKEKEIFELLNLPYV